MTPECHQYQGEMTRGVRDRVGLRRSVSCVDLAGPQKADIWSNTSLAEGDIYISRLGVKQMVLWNMGGPHPIR